MFQSKKLTMITIFMVTFGLTYGIDFDSIKNSITGGIDSVMKNIEGSVCLAQNRDKFDVCNSDMAEFTPGAASDDTTKRYCCQFLGYRKCVENVAMLYCGGNAESTVESIMTGMKTMYPYNCSNYNNFFDCLDPIWFWAIVALIVIGAIALVSIVISCVKRICC